MSSSIVTKQEFTKQELDLIVSALEIKFDIDNDTSTEELFDLEQQAVEGRVITADDVRGVVKQLNTKMDNLLLLQRLQIRMVQAKHELFDLILAEQISAQREERNASQVY